ncbi:hypothetical protein K1T71_005593 [Dendrolimus kikuchii]|uniref:Uncharacterized protein n=1 Tax=Dendrolimus kikuchii TaxID=765133 RepID=A0ACC1D4K0_9NEOP|nr:hypothetical protein K1T71_005593 [Dendrolimus kikuchii]
MDSTVQDDEYLNTNDGVGSWVDCCEMLKSKDMIPNNSVMTRSEGNEHQIFPRRDEEIEDMDLESISRADKRSRENSREEVWTTVTRKGKRFAGGSHNQDSSANPVDTTEVSITSEKILPKQFKLAKLFQEENIQHVIKIKYVNPYKVLVQFSKEDSAYKLIESQSFKEKGLKCQATFELAHTYGVIKDIDIDVTEEDILNNFKSDKEIIGVKRLKRRNHVSGKWEPSECVRVCFEGSALPKYSYIFRSLTTVHTYIYPITQCSRCWRFGHTMKTCPSAKFICPKCSDFHANCETTDFKCQNCSGRHMALSRICPVYKKEKRIRELMSEFNCSYKKALMIFVPPEPSPICNEEPTNRFSAYQQDEYETNLQKVTTYADVLKSTNIKAAQKEGQKKKDNKKQKRKSKRQQENADLNTIWESSSGDLDTVNEPFEESMKGNRERSTHYLKLLEQLKEKILDKKLTFGLKIKECAKIVFDWIKSTLMQYLTQLPFLSYIKSWITDSDIQESI